jgi:hypothetical protein
VALFGVLMIIVGLIGVLNPRLTWWLEIGWKLKDAEPSELALILNRVVGIIIIMAGFFVIISG